MKIQKKNIRDTERKKLSLPFAAAPKIAKYPSIKTTPKYVNNVIYKWNKGENIVGKKALKIIRAAKALDKEE
jgi:hypothetical protein